MIPFSFAFILYQFVPLQMEMPCDMEWWYSCHTPILICALLVCILNKIPDWELILGHALLFWCFGAHIHLDLIWMGAVMASIVGYLENMNKSAKKSNYTKYIQFYPFIGVYIGAFTGPLDWDVHWQYFPYLSLILAIGLADFCQLTILARTEKIKKS